MIVSLRHSRAQRPVEQFFEGFRMQEACCHLCLSLNLSGSRPDVVQIWLLLLEAVIAVDEGMRRDRATVLL